MFNKITSTIIVYFLLFSSVFTQDNFSDESVKESVSVTGVVIDASTGKPIAGANVILDEGDGGAAADEEGKFNIDGVNAGSSITASAIGYEDLTLYAD